MDGNAPITDRLPDGAGRPAAAVLAVNMSGVDINPCPSRDRLVRSRRGPTAPAPTGMAMSLDTCSRDLSHNVTEPGFGPRLSQQGLSQPGRSQSTLSQRLARLAPRPGGDTEPKAEVRYEAIAFTRIR
jgi:hypothetical protein